MKKMLAVIAILALCATSAMADDLVQSGKVTVTLDVKAFSEIIIDPAQSTINLDVKGTQATPEGTGMGTGGNFTIRTNCPITYQVSANEVTPEVIGTSGDTSHYNPTARIGGLHANWGIGYGLMCYVGTTGEQFASAAGTDMVGFSKDLDVGNHTGYFTLNTYLDSARRPGEATNVVPQELAPEGIYTSVLTLTLVATPIPESE